MSSERHPFLAKALQNVEAAQLLLGKDLYDAAANRAYFAAYQAARAALQAGVKRDEDDHKKLQAAFATELVNRRKVYPGSGATLNELMILRHVADYDAERVSVKRAQRQVKKAEDFVLAIQRNLEG